MLVIAVCAVIAGADSWTDIASYGRSKEDWLRTFLRLEGGTIFTIINPETFDWIIP